MYVNHLTVNDIERHDFWLLALPISVTSRPGV